MRKSIGFIVCFSLLSCLFINLSAQTDEELDQVELLKQFVGTWEADIGKDSVTVVTFTPINNGLQFVQEYKANGEVYLTLPGVMGFSEDKQMIHMIAIIPDGTFILDKGRFEPKTKYKVDRYYGNTSHAAQMVEWEFLTPESLVGRGKWRGDGMTWTPEWNEWDTFKKVK